MRYLLKLKISIEAPDDPAAREAACRFLDSKGLIVNVGYPTVIGLDKIYEHKPPKSVNLMLDRYWKRRKRG